MLIATQAVEAMWIQVVVEFAVTAVGWIGSAAAVERVILGGVEMRVEDISMSIELWIHAHGGHVGEVEGIDCGAILA